MEDDIKKNLLLMGLKGKQLDDVILYMSSVICEMVNDLIYDEVDCAIESILKYGG